MSVRMKYGVIPPHL